MFVVLASLSAFAQTPRLGGKLVNAVPGPGPRLKTSTAGSSQLSNAPAANKLVLRPPVIYSSGGVYPGALTVADLNGDGKPDLVVANANSSFDVLLGNGDGTFQPAVSCTLPSGYTPAALAIGDANGDGKPDLLVGLYSPNGDAFGVLLGNGDGTLQPALVTAIPGFVNAMAAADLNGDGRLDVVMSNWLGTVEVLLGNGDATFQPVAAYNSGADSDSVTIADVNGDGIPDLMLGDETTVAVLLGKGDGTFLGRADYPVSPIALPPYGVGGIAVADLNGDGKADLIVANQGGQSNGNGSVGVLFGNGDGTFQPAVIYDSGSITATTVAVADFDGDGKLDVVVANWESKNPGLIGILIGNGDGTLQPVVTYDSGGLFPVTVVAADVNADGRPDILVANMASQTVAVLLNATGISSTSTTLTAFQALPPTGQYALYTATVTNASGGPVSGTVTFYDGTVMLGTVALKNNQALQYEHLRRRWWGTVRLITAVYSGDANNSPSTSDVLHETVKAFTWVRVGTSGSPSFVGQPVTFTAYVHAAGIYPVTFSDQGKVLATVPWTQAGGWFFTTSFSDARQHTIRADFPDSVDYFPSYAVINQQVNKYATTTTLRSQTNPSQRKQPVTLTVSVSSAGPTPATGRVRFLDGTTWLGSGTLNGGVATLTHRFSAGTHSITALYRGDAASAQSASTVLSQVVQ